MAAPIPAFASPIQGPVEVDLSAYTVGGAVAGCADGREAPETAAAGRPALEEKAAFGFRRRTKHVHSTFFEAFGCRITDYSRANKSMYEMRTPRKFCFV
jgi:hypothetical protein